MSRKFKHEVDITRSDQDGAPVRTPFAFKPLDVRKYINAPRRRAHVENAPSVIGGKLYRDGVTA